MMNRFVPARPWFGHGSIIRKLAERAEESGDTLVIDRPEPAAEIIPEPIVEPLPAPPRPIAAHHTDLMTEAHIAAYHEVANAIGFNPPGATIEAFKVFLKKHDIPVFSRRQVVAYMDDKAAKFNETGCGWEWKALREKDHVISSWGTACVDRRDWGPGHDAKLSPASDYYLGRRMTYQNSHGSSGGFATAVAVTIPPPPPYDKLVPLHALKKVALIEGEFKKPVSFFVCDYATEPHVGPDPFLMAVVEHNDIVLGTGRFIIDFWDEPGFGIEQMLAT